MRLGILALALVCAGCAAPHQIVDRQDFLAEAMRLYPGEERERVIKAAETVLKISDPTDWDFRYTLNGFVGLRRYVIYAVIAAANGREKWEFLSDPDGSGAIRASVSISEAGAATDGWTSQPYENKMASIPLYRLFWDRVDYMLGKRPDWVTCDEAAAKLGQNPRADSLGGLCGPTSEGRNAPPPEPLPALARPPVAKRGIIKRAPPRA